MNQFAGLLAIASFVAYAIAGAAAVDALGRVRLRRLERARLRQECRRGTDGAYAISGRHFRPVASVSIATAKPARDDGAWIESQFSAQRPIRFIIGVEK